MTRHTEIRYIGGPLPGVQYAVLEGDRIRLRSGRSGAPLTGRQVADHLTAVRSRLARDGWAPGDRDRGIVATLTNASLGGHDTARGAWLMLELSLEGRGERPDLEAWECRAGRTRDQVRELLTTAAQIARECGPQGGDR